MTRLPAVLATPARPVGSPAMEELAMTTTSARRAGTVRAALWAGTFAIAAAQAWPPTLIGDGFSPTDDPDSAYFRDDVAPPSSQGRPYVIPETCGLARPQAFRREML